jgi:hypothetical protein
VYGQFLDWYEDDIAGGTLAFDVQIMRFGAGLATRKAVFLEPYQATTDDGLNYIVSAKLQVADSAAALLPGGDTTNSPGVGGGVVGPSYAASPYGVYFLDTFSVDEIIPDYWLWDKFNGSSRQYLYDHTSDIPRTKWTGEIYTDPSFNIGIPVDGPTSGLETPVVEGGSTIIYSGADRSGGHSLAPIPQQGYFVEYDIDSGPDSANGYGFLMYVGTAATNFDEYGRIVDTGDGYLFDLSWYFSDGSGGPGLVGSDFGGVVITAIGGLYSGRYYSVPYFTGTTTVRVEVLPPVLRIIINGTSYYGRVTAITPPLNVGFQLNLANDGLSGVSVKEIRVGPITSIPAAPPVAYVYDTFTGTNGTLLQAHSPDIGSTWQRHYGSSDLNFVIQGNALEPNSYAGGSVVELWNENATVVPVANVTVQLDVVFTGSSSYIYLNLYARGNGTDAVVGQFFLQSGYSYTTAGSVVAADWNSDHQSCSTPSFSGTHTFKMTVTGAVVTMFIDSAQVGSHTIVGAPSGTGTVGFGMYGSFGDLTYQHIDEFKALG